jgi:hypothetical protein
MESDASDRKRSLGPRSLATNEERTRSQTLKVILAPIHEDFRRSGMTEDELQSLIEEARREIFQEKQRRKAVP